MVITGKTKTNENGYGGDIVIILMSWKNSLNYFIISEVYFQKIAETVGLNLLAVYFEPAWICAEYILKSILHNVKRGFVHSHHAYYISMQVTMKFLQLISPYNNARKKSGGLKYSSALLCIFFDFQKIA
jgi:hypothetical protein